MAKQAVTHKIITTEELKLSGIVSSDGTTMDLDGLNKKIADYFVKFAGKLIDVTLKEKNEEEFEE